MEKVEVAHKSGAIAGIYRFSNNFYLSVKFYEYN